MQVLKSSVSRKESLRDFPSREAEDDLVGENVKQRERQRWKLRRDKRLPHHVGDLRFSLDKVQDPHDDNPIISFQGCQATAIPSTTLAKYTPPPCQMLLPQATGHLSDCPSRPPQQTSHMFSRTITQLA